MKPSFFLLIFIIPLFSFGQNQSWWQPDGSLKIENAEHTFRSPIVNAKDKIREAEMFLVDLNVYRGQEQGNISYGIYSKGLGHNASANLKVYHRKVIDSKANPNISPNYGFDFNEDDYLVYGSETSEGSNSNFTNHEESWDAYGYYAHGWNFRQSQIKSTDYEHLWNRPKSATWWDTLYDVTIGVLAVAVIVAATVVTAGAAAALFGGITVAGTATISISTGTIAAALYTAGTSLYITYSIYKHQGYLLDTVDNRGYSHIIPQSEFETNMELPVPDKISNPSSDEEKKWNESIDAIEKSAFNCSNKQGQSCYKAPIREMVAEMTIKNTHVKYVNIPGELHKNITPYQLFENYNYITDENGVISTSSFTQSQLVSAADYFDSKRQVLPKNMLRPTEGFTFDFLLENFNGIPTYYIASKTPPDMDSLFYLDLGLYGVKNGHNYHLYRIQVNVNAGEIPFTTGPDGPFMVGDNIELEEKLYDDLTINVYRDEETPIITQSYSIAQPNPTESLRLQPGDSVVFTSSYSDFFLEGVPEIWLARSGGDSKYYCSPNTKPDEYRPFLGYDSQVHGVALRKHPHPENKKTPKLIHNEEANTYSWHWIAQRRLDANIGPNHFSSSGNNITFSKYKTASDLGKTDFPIGGGERVTKQRNNQREGYNMQLLYSWEDKENYDEYSGPGYILGLDPDEIIYLNSNGAKIPSPDTKLPDALLGVNVEEWKRMPEGENANPIAEMVEAYVKNRNFVEDGVTHANSYEYDGYEIMDEGIFHATTIDGVSADNAPCNGKPCVEYSNKSSVEDNNIKAPGLFKFKKVYPDGIHTGSSINIPVDLESVQQTDYGFYGSIEGDQWPSEWQKQVPYSFKGLDGLPNSILNKLVMEYSHENELGILTTDTRYFRDSGSVVDGKWTEYFDLKGWGYNEITVYVQRKPGATKVPIAGMELLEIMIRFVSAPGSKWKDFSPTPFEGIDLKEGRGEGNFWYLRDSNQDESNHFLYGNPSDAINKSYTISKDDRIVFNAMDSDPHTFFHYDIEWYVSERFMSKRLSTEELSSRIQWFLAPIDYDGLGEWVGNGRWLDKTFDFPGKYRLTAVYGLNFDKNNDLYSNTRMSHIINVLSAAYDSSDDANKGTIDIYEMSSDQIDWIQQEYPEVDSSWRVASINNIFSRWTHVDGPRAEPPNDKPNRYGNENDYNAHFEWFENNSGREHSIDKYSLQKYVTTDTNLDWFPYNWIRHYSGSSLPSDMDISLVPGGLTTSQAGIDNVLRDAFPNNTPEHWQWRLPWISITNWQGYKIRNNIKAVFNMTELFDNQKGAFSGVGVQHMSNEDYANHVKYPIQAYTDNYKSKYDFYLDLLSGRKQIFNPNNESFFGSLSVNQVNDLDEDQNDVNSVIITKPNLNYKEDDSFLMGADMSIIKNLEDGGITWKRSELAKEDEDPYYILSSSGANTVRFRLWVNPKKTDGSDYPYSRLSSVKEEILRVKEMGLKVILDLHYSDTWADPNQNIIPNGWVHGISESSADGNVDFLASQITTYTESVLNELNDSHALPDIVQVGNEINGNILLTDAYHSLTVNQIAAQIGVSVSDLSDDKYKINWDRNARLINAGLAIIKNNYPEVKTMLHLASPFFTQWWLNEAFNQNATDRLGTETVNQDLVDIVGMSYYMGELDQQQSLPVIKQIIDNIGELYDKKVLIVETAFPQTYDWSDNTPNLYSELNNGAWPTETDFSKQYNWLLTLRETLKTSPYSLGFMYWEPFWVGSNSVETKDFIGSNWENMSFCPYANGISTRENIVNVNGGLKVFNDPILNTNNDNKGGSFNRQGIDQKSQSSKLNYEKSEQPDFKVYVTPKDENIIVSLFPRAKYNIEVFDLQGKLIHSGLVSNVHSHLVYLKKLGFGKQIILIKVTDENGHQQIKKLIVK